MSPARYTADMAVIVPLGQFQSVIEWRLTGDLEPMVVTLGTSHPDPDVDATGMAFVIGSSLLDSPLGLAGNILQGYTLNRVITYKQEGGGFSVGELNLGVVGTVVSATMPQNCAVLVRKNTALAGRKQRGRWYMPPAYVNEATVDGTGTINAVGVAAMQGYINQFRTELDERGAVPVLFHSDGLPSTPITSFTVDSRIATQRKRLRR